MQTHTHFMDVTHTEGHKQLHKKTITRASLDVAFHFSSHKLLWSAAVTGHELRESEFKLHFFLKWDLAYQK